MDFSNPVPLTTQMPSLGLPGSKLSALAGLLAGLTKGVGDLSSSRREDAARQQLLQQQAIQNQFERDRIAQSDKQFQFNKQDKLSDNARADARDEQLARQALGAQVKSGVENSTGNSSIAPDIGNAAYGDPNARKTLAFDPAILDAIKGQMTQTPQSMSLKPSVDPSGLGLPTMAPGGGFNNSGTNMAYAKVPKQTEIDQAAGLAQKQQTDTERQAAQAQIDAVVSKLKGNLPAGKIGQTDADNFLGGMRQLDPSVFRKAGVTPEQVYANVPDVANFMKVQTALASRPVGLTASQSDTQMNGSYNKANTQLQSLRKPISDQLDRLSRLSTTLAQGSPAADALIAPELLTAMAGGQGSGLRMNEAEISRIVGGRSAMEDLKATLGRLTSDPNHPFAVTGAQRQQMKALTDAITGGLNEKLGKIDTGINDLIDAPDVTSHRRIVAGVQQGLTAAQSAGNATRPQKTLPNGHTIEQQPDGGWVVVK